MIFMFYILDKADSPALRAPLRQLHRAYIGQVAERVAFAGPLVTDDGQTIIGSLLALDFPDREAARQWIDGEPYARGGVYQSIQIHAFNNRWAQKTGFPDAS